MADIGMNFDATQVDPSTSFVPLPDDWYNAMISESEMKQTKDGNGAYLELTFKVMDGPQAGRTFRDRLNLYNQNPVAVEIAQKSLSAICHAVDVFQVQDSQVLHGKPLMARVVETPPKDGYDAGNDVKGYAKTGAKESKNGAGIKLDSKYGGSAPAAPAAPGGSAPAPDFTPPWSAPQQQAPAQPQQPAAPQQQPQAPQQPPAPAQQPPSNAPVTPPWAQ